MAGAVSPTQTSLLCTEALVDAFADATGDFSAIHMDAEFARLGRYRRRVVHGMLPVFCLLARQGRFRLEAEIFRAQAEHIAREQAGTRQKHEADGNLRHDEKIAQTRKSEASPESRAFVFQSRDEVSARGVQSGRQARGDRCDQRQRDCASDDATVRTEAQHLPHLSQRRPLRGSERQHQWTEDLERPQREHEAGRSAHRAQQQILCKQLPDDPTATRTERQPHANLLLASHTAREQEVGDVGACKH